MLFTLFVLSLLGGFCSGLLGVGGAVLLIPLLLAVPRLVGVGALSMHEVSGITMVQVFSASLTGCLAHRRSGLAHMPTILAVGVPLGIFSFAGAAASRSMTSRAMLLVFCCLVALAWFMLLKRSVHEASETTDFDFNKPLSVVSGSCVGFVAGVVGAGGGFILIPVMIRILKIPIRVAVGSSLGIMFIGAAMGSLGKIVTLQVPWAYLLPVIAGSLPSALLGARVSRKIPPAWLRRILLVLVLLILIKSWHEFYLVSREEQPVVGQPAEHRSRTP